MNTSADNLLTTNEAIIVIANYWCDMLILDEFKEEFFKSLVAILKKNSINNFLLFVDGNLPSVDLSKALEDAGIDSNQKVFPEKVWMYVDRYKKENHAELYMVSVKWYDKITILS